MVDGHEQAQTDAEIRADDVEGVESRSEEEEEEEEESEEEGGAIVETLGEGFYEVEAVRRKRVRKGQVQYLIKWRGWPESANTWEPFDNVKACADVIDEFEKSDTVKQGRRRRGKRKFGTYILPQKKKRSLTLNVDDGSAAISVSRNEEGEDGKKSGLGPAVTSRGSPECMQHVSTEPFDAGKNVSQDKSDYEDFDTALPDCRPKSGQEKPQVKVTESEQGKDSEHDFVDVAVKADVSESKEIQEKHSLSGGGERASLLPCVGGELDREIGRQDSTVNRHHDAREGFVQTETGCSEQHFSLPVEGATLEENKEVGGHTSSIYVEKKMSGELGKAIGIDKCAGAKKRKQGFVRRVRQSLDSQEVDTKAALDEEKPIDCAQVSEQEKVPKGLGTQGGKRDAESFQIHEPKGPTHRLPASPQSLQFVAPTVPPSHITRIIKAVNYSNSSVNGKQDATVVFKGLRADGQEVLVDNKFMRANYPLLLIDFYEQHLRNSPSTAV